jgi:hypothetical protein
VLQRFAQDFWPLTRQPDLRPPSMATHPKSRSPPPTCAAAPARACSSAWLTCLPRARCRAKARDKLFLRVIGSPDPYAAHIDGMGGATSSTSKCVILSKSSVPDHDVDYLYGQVSIDKAFVDWSATAATCPRRPAPSPSMPGWWMPARIPHDGMAWCASGRPTSRRPSSPTCR